MQFASMLTAGPVCKVASQQGKAFCVFRFELSRFVITVQREIRARFRRDAPHKNNVTRWYRQFVETGCLCKGKNSGRPRVSDDSNETVREAFQRSPLQVTVYSKQGIGHAKMNSAEFVA